MSPLGARSISTKPAGLLAAGQDGLSHRKLLTPTTVHSHTYMIFMKFHWPP